MALAVDMYVSIYMPTRYSIILSAFGLSTKMFVKIEKMIRTKYVFE